MGKTYGATVRAIEADDYEVAGYYGRARIRRLEKARLSYGRRNARRQQLRDELREVWVSHFELCGVGGCEDVAAMLGIQVRG